MNELDEIQGREPAFDAVIPAPVRYNDALSANAKLLYGEIRALSNRYGYCFATNVYFADLYQLTDRTIARLISQLSELGYIRIKITRDTAGHVSGRRIYIGCGFPEQDNDTLTHMTKKSANMTKSSPLNDKNDSQDIIKYNNKQEKDARVTEAKKKHKKKQITGEEAREMLTVWARKTFPENCEPLISALMDFIDVREAQGSDMDTVGIVNRCTNRLIDLSDGKLPVILAMLDKAIRKRWTDTYPLKPDELPFAIADSPSYAREDGGPQWL